jgi:DNA-binding transcriptional ArsR family regulator
VKEIAKAVGMKDPNVSIELTKCLEGGLIEKVVSSSGEVVWRKKRTDTVLRISEFVRKKFRL